VKINKKHSFFFLKNFATAMQILKTIIIGRYLPINDVGEVVLALSFAGGMESGMSSLFNDDIYTNITEKNSSDTVKKVRNKEFKYNCVLALLLAPIIFLTAENKSLAILAVLLPLNAGIGAAKAVSVFLKIQQQYSKIELLFGFLSLILYAILITNLGVKGFIIAIIFSYIINQVLSQNFINNRTKGANDSFTFLPGSFNTRLQIIIRVAANSFNNTIDNMAVGLWFTPNILGSYSIFKSTMAFGSKIANPIIIWSHSKSVRATFDNRNLARFVINTFAKYSIIVLLVGIVVGLNIETVVSYLYNKKLSAPINIYVLLFFITITRYFFVFMKPFMAKHNNRKRSLLYSILPLVLLPVLLAFGIQNGLLCYTVVYIFICLTYLFDLDELIYSRIRSF
jgi:hypothetical protein